MPTGPPGRWPGRSSQRGSPRDGHHQDREQPVGPTPPEGEIAGIDWRLGLLILGVVAFGVLAGKGWLIMVGALVVMITLHELGHFLTAKWTGMKVTEFFLFFGPKIWSFKRGETEYGIKLIPLGAYVRIIGMSNIDTDVPPRGRAPHLPAAVVSEATAGRVGRLDHALPAGLRPLHHRVLGPRCARRRFARRAARWAAGRRVGLDRRQRGRRLRRRRRPGCGPVTRW